MKFGRHTHNWGDIGCLTCKAPRPYHLQPYTYKYSPDFPALPQPWRDHEFAKNVYLLPMDVATTFADFTYLRKIERSDTLRITELRESMLTEGLKVPVTLVIDSAGKVRYHDGYHRLSVMLEHPKLFTHIPCILNHSTGTIRGYGRTLTSEIDTIFKFLSRNAE